MPDGPSAPDEQHPEALAHATLASEYSPPGAQVSYSQRPALQESLAPCWPSASALVIL